MFIIAALYSLFAIISLLPCVWSNTLLLAAPNGGLWGARTDEVDKDLLHSAPELGYPQRGLYYGSVNADPLTGNCCI